MNATLSARSRFRSLSLTALSSAAVVAGLSAMADEPDKKAARDQLVEGVIVKVEPVEKGKDRVRITVNSAAVWRDYVRDSATAKGESTEKSAKKGDESVATKGQPESEDDLTTIEVGPGSKVETRYRLAIDERTLGAPTVEGARKLADPETAEPKEAGKALPMGKLKAGLFVHLHYHRGDKRDEADRVVVLEPVRDESKE